MSAITTRTEIGPAPRFDRAWRNEATGLILSHVYLNNDAYLAFDSAAEARALAAEIIKAAEEMELIDREHAPETPAPKEA